MLIADASRAQRRRSLLHERDMWIDLWIDQRARCKIHGAFMGRALMTGGCPRELAQAVAVTGCNSREHARPT